MEKHDGPRKRAKRQDNTGAYWYATGEGRWRAQFFDAEGKLRYLSARTEQEIASKLDRAIAKRDQGSLGLAPQETPTLGEWLDIWLDSKYQLKPKTVQRYRVDIEGIIKPALGSVRVDQLRASMVEALYGRLANEHALSASSVKHVHATLSSALNSAYRHDIVPTQVMAKVAAPRVPSNQRRIMDYEAIQRFLDAAGGRSHACYLRWRLALLWGLRQGEALGLRWQDIDLVTGVLSIRQQLQYFPSQGMVEGTPKSSSSNRSFRLDPQTTRDLRQHRKDQLTQRMGTAGWLDHDLVFSTETGRPIDTANDRRQFKRILTECGLGDFRVHDARHTAITHLALDGVPLTTIKEISGHSDIRVTSSYVHPTSEAFDDAAEKVRRRFGG